MIYRFCHIHSRTPGVLFAFLPGLFLSSFTSSTFSLSFFLCVCVCVVSSIIFHFSRSYPSLAASFATLSSLCATLPSLLTEYRDSSLPSFFHSIALLSAALPFSSLSLFHILFSFFFIPFSFLFILYRCLPFAASFLFDSSFSFRLITQYALSFFPLCHSLFCLSLAISVSSLLTLPLILFLLHSCTLFLFSYLFSFLHSTWIHPRLMHSFPFSLIFSFSLFF